jgi:ABC-2 type transport system permease protein
LTVLGRFLRDRRRSTLWWLLGVVATVLLTVGFYPSIEGQESFDDMAAEMPEAVRELFGLGGTFSMSSPEGFLQSQLFATMLPILLIVFGIGIGARAIGGSEEDGTLELLLANPVTRRRVLLERYGTLVLLHLVLVAAMVVATFAVGVPVGATEGIPVAWLAAAFAGVLLLGLLYATVAFAVGALTGTRGKAIAVGAATAIGGYLVEGLGSTADALAPAQAISPWHWFLERNMLGEGVAWQAILLPLAVVAVLVLVAVPGFERRDLR